MSIQKIDTLLNSIRVDLFYIQEKLEKTEDFEKYGPYFSPAHDAYTNIETHTKNFVNFIEQFTPPKQRPKKYKRVVLELINLDKQKILTEQIGNYEE